MRNFGNRGKYTCMNCVTMAHVWDQFDKIVCISLRESVDRQNSCRSVFSSVGLQEKVEFFYAERSDKGAVYGTFESHFFVIQKAFESDCKNVLIFEDDILFADNWLEPMKDIANVPQASWDMLSCGTPIFITNQGGDVVRSKYWMEGKAILSHMYALSRRGMSIFLEHFPQPKAIPFDDALVELPLRTLITYSFHCFRQDLSLESSNPWGVLRYLEDSVNLRNQQEEERADLVKRVAQIGVQEELLPVVAYLAKFWSLVLPERYRPWMLPVYQGAGTVKIVSGAHNHQRGTLIEFPPNMGALGTLSLLCAGLYSIFKFQPKDTSVSKFELARCLIESATACEP